ncbi:MAG: glycosyltransferase [Nitrospira sp.]|nr:glycosyltransferase [Nitrospira sp.]
MTAIPTKIMYLVDHYAGPQAGTEGQLLKLVQHLDRSRFQPAITLFRGSDWIEHNSFGCPMQVLHLTKLASPTAIIKVSRFAQTLRREGYRLVHCFLNDVSLISPPLLRAFGIRVMVSRRDMGFWYTPGNLAVLRLVSPFVDSYVANCQAVAGVVEQKEWVPSRKISVVYNGLFPRADHHRELSQEAVPSRVFDKGTVVGIVANLKPIKRIDVLIQAIAVVRKQCPGIRLVVIGKDGPSNQGRSMREELEELAGRLGLCDQVVFMGAVDDPVPYIKQFAVAVLCSESEGLSNSMLEYMQARRPIICSDTGGNPELVQDGKNGFLVPVGDVVALAERLIRLLTDSALARRFGEAAGETVRSMCAPHRMLEEQMACYDAVLSGSRFSWSPNEASRTMQ